MNSVTAAAHTADPHTVTVIDEGQSYERRWHDKAADAQHVWNSPEAMRTTPMLLIPYPALGQLVYVAGPDQDFPLQDHLQDCKPFLLQHDVWVSGSMPTWQRLYLIQVRAFQLNTERQDKPFRLRILSIAANPARDRQCTPYKRVGLTEEFEDASSTFLEPHKDLQIYERHLGMAVTPCPTFGEIGKSDKETDRDDQEREKNEEYPDQQAPHPQSWRTMREWKRSMKMQEQQDTDDEDEYYTSDEEYEDQDSGY